MTEVIVTVESLESGFWAFIDDLPGCATHVKVKTDLIEETKICIQHHLEAMIEDGDEIPEKFKGKYSLTFKEE